MLIIGERSAFFSEEPMLSFRFNFFSIWSLLDEMRMGMIFSGSSIFSDSSGQYQLYHSITLFARVLMVCFRSAARYYAK